MHIGKVNCHKYAHLSPKASDTIASWQVDVKAMIFKKVPITSKI